MNELALSNNLSQIELEINHHKQIAGQSIWEIGRRLNHVKEHDLAHGQFGKWLDKVKISHSEARKMMTISKQLSNRSTLNDLGTSALYLIATLPDDEKQNQLDRIEQGESPTVQELRLLRQRYSDAKHRIAQLESHQPQPQIKEVVKEVAPPDYRQAIEQNKTLAEHNKVYAERNEYLEKTLKDLYAQRAEVDEKSAKYDELTKAIQESQGQLNDYQKKIASYKNILNLIHKGNEFLVSMGGLIYADEERVLQVDGIAGQEFDSFVNRGLRFFTDLDKIRKKDIEILEGEVL